MNKKKIDKIIEIVNKKGVLRPRDIEQYNIPRQYIYELYKAGKLQKIGRGLYKMPDMELSEDEMLIEVVKKVPRAVLCLLSALRFHDMTTQNPFQIWIAIHHKDWTPKLDLPIRIIRMTGAALEEGIEEHIVDNIKISVYNPAKTVADCFKFRNSVGIDVCIEALRDYKREKKGTMDELLQYAKIDRIQKIISPYMESLYES